MYLRNETELLDIDQNRPRSSNSNGARELPVLNNATRKRKNLEKEFSKATNDVQSQARRQERKCNARAAKEVRREERRERKEEMLMMMHGMLMMMVDEDVKMIHQMWMMMLDEDDAEDKLLMIMMMMFYFCIRR